MLYFIISTSICSLVTVWRIWCSRRSSINRSVRYNESQWLRARRIKVHLAVLHLHLLLHLCISVSELFLCDSVSSHNPETCRSGRLSASFNVSYYSSNYLAMSLWLCSSLFLVPAGTVASLSSRKNKTCKEKKKTFVRKSSKIFPFPRNRRQRMST